MNEDKDTYWRLDQIRMRGESVLRYVSQQDVMNASTEALVVVLRMVAEELGVRGAAISAVERMASQERGD